MIAYFHFHEDLLVQLVDILLEQFVSHDFVMICVHLSGLENDINELADDFHGDLLRCLSSTL